MTILPTHLGDDPKKGTYCRNVGTGILNRFITPSFGIHHAGHQKPLVKIDPYVVHDSLLKNTPFT